MKILARSCALAGVLLLLLAPGAPVALHAAQPPAAQPPAAPAAAEAPAAGTPAAEAPAAPGAAGSPDFESDLATELDKEFADTAGEERPDPLGGYNRFMTDFNDGLYEYLLSPVARGYRFVVPEFARRGVANLFDNLLFPVRFVNNLAQLKLVNTGTETARFVLNSTVGVAGLWDPARLWFDLERRPEDFGQTLGYYGVGPGPHVVLPVFGPSNARDAVSMVPDYFLEPVTYVSPWEAETMIRSYDRVNYTSLHLGEYEDLKKDAIDLYPFLRDLYEQNRISEIEK